MNYVKEEQARKEIIKAGLMLLEKGLVSRTWGNISARISEKYMLITPSGRSYDSLRPEDLVRVKIENCHYRSSIKPSSETMVHAACYMERPECRFIVHTHQFYASAISITETNFSFAPTAAYALPGTKELADAVAECVAAHPNKDAFLLRCHGALYLSDSIENAFSLAETVEKESKEEFARCVPKIDLEKDLYDQFRAKYRRLPAFIDDFSMYFGVVLLVSPEMPIETFLTDDKEAQRLILLKNIAAALYAKSKKMGPLSGRDRKMLRDNFLESYSKLKDTNI